ncbi:hypothetical protein GJAV_G00101980 [Gymnothorax javanicus]|nr:hypothetical protein GJAV_G00101980 [Gymnothorax javanicus]
MTEMDRSTLFSTLYAVCGQVVTVLSDKPSEMEGDSAQRMLGATAEIVEHARGIEPVIAGLTAVFHHFDFDPLVPGNGYRSLVKVVHACILHIIQKGRYIATNCRKLFFRAPHNTKEMEAYCSVLCQLRALLYLAQRLLHNNDVGNLYCQEEGGLSSLFAREYASMYKACFYGRCLGFQFSPAVRPFLQTAVTGLVSFGENYKKHKSRIGIAASSFLNSGKYVVDPELRGSEFERAIQNMDVQFWKSFWNLSETELLSGLATIVAAQVQVSRTLSIPPVPFKLPLASDPLLSVPITPPVAHYGPGPVNVRLVSHKLLQGQNSEEMLAFYHSPLAFSLATTKPSPPSPWLLVHFHGGGFVAHTSKSHESYLRSWAQDLGMPILSVDYSLAPEAPFPRALEECFYAYCWALKHCHLLGSTGERVCLAGDSAGGNLCIAVAMRTLSQGVRVPDGILAAYPATLLTTYASPSRLLTLIDPMLPLSVLYKCLSAYAGTEPLTEPSEREEPIETQSATAQDKDPSVSQTDQKLAEAPSDGFVSPPHRRDEYPDGFQPLRSEQLAKASVLKSPINRNPYVSPLLAPDDMLQGLPPIHIVACALDALLDDSVMFARRLRSLKQPVTLHVVEDLPHGFLCLQVCKETQEANSICLARMREVFSQGQGNPNHETPSPAGATNQESESSDEKWTKNTEGQEPPAGDGQER